jgi:cyclopropane-fatty-acyl-phospholipid synthase
MSSAASAELWPDVVALPAGQSRIRSAMVATAIDPAARRLGFRVIYPDGRTHGSQDPHAPSLRLNRPDAVYRRVAAGGLIGFGEAYQAGDWDSDDLPGLLERVASRAGEAQWLRSPLPRTARSRQPRSATSTAAGSAPCENLPEEFFTQMLDETMTYSSALFDGDGGGLADAQRRKIDRVLDVAGVAQGTTLLEIGTGWGELAIMAARRGARVHTVTDSPGSAAEERIAAAGVAARIHLELCGYQDIQPIVRNGYDAVVSVEMIEAIAEEHWPGYFGALERNLAPGGRIVIQAITMRHERLVATRGRYTWINKYVRPRGQIPSVTAIEQVCQQAGLEVHDGAGFGASYARTFALWRERFASNSDAVAALGFDEIFRRTWDLYLAFRQASFASGFLDVRHLMLERSTDMRDAKGAAAEQERAVAVSAVSGEAPTSRWVDLGGRVHYADYGGPAGKPLLVCVHGIGGSEASWAPIAPALASGYRVLAVDLAGFGRSKGNGLPATLAANQELLHQFLLKVADGPVVLVAHSMGGTIAAMVAAKHPEAVCGLVLINPAVPWVRDELDRRLTAARATLTQVFRTGSWQSDPDTPSRTTDSVLTARLFGQYRSGARDLNWSRGPDPHMTAAAVSLASTLLRRREFAAMLSSIKVPVLWLHGEDDPAVPVKAAREYASRWPAWQFHVAPGVGHELHCEVPEWTIGHIRSLVDQLGTSPDD